MKKEAMIPQISVHPGAVLRDELQERRLTQRKFALHIAALPTTVNAICREKGRISAEMACKLSRAFGASPAFWINLQRNWELLQVDPKRLQRIGKLEA